MKEPRKTVLLSVSEDEALVLFEFLSRFSEKDELSIEDQAEMRVLWDLCALLEQQLVQPFKDNYVSLLDEARASVRDVE